MLQLTARHVLAVHRARRRSTLLGQQHAGDVGEGAAGADHAGTAPLLHGKTCANLTTQRPPQLVDRATPDPFSKKTFGGAHGAEWHREQALDEAVGRQGEFHRTAADVAGHHAPVCEIE